ncbi:hypothetical protein DFJ77DRAFT_508116 [Powellomyces hirtus]|nr:hypothetical protein DFJ77DRAFT_508116 [Powellomyces hirtus]
MASTVKTYRLSSSSTSLHTDYPQLLQPSLPPLTSNIRSPSILSVQPVISVVSSATRHQPPHLCWSVTATPQAKRMSAVSPLRASDQDQKPKTVAKRRSRSLTVWKEDFQWSIGARPDAPIPTQDVDIIEGVRARAVRRSRSLSPVAIQVKARDAKTVPKKRDGRPARRTSAATNPSWSSSKRLSRSSKIHPFGNDQGLTPQPAVDEVPETTPSVEIPPLVASVMENVAASPAPARLPASVEQAIYAAAYQKIMDPKRSASSRMTIANLMQYIQSVQPGVQLLSEFPITSPPLSLPHHSTSAPWTSDALPVVQPSTPANVTAPILLKKQPSAVAIARRNNRRRLAKIVAGTPLGPGPSSLRHETPMSRWTSTTKDVMLRKASFAQKSATSSVAGAADVGYPARKRSKLRPRSHGEKIDFQIIPVPATEVRSVSGVRRVWRFFKQTFGLTDPAKRSKRRESAFYNPADQERINASLGRYPVTPGSMGVVEVRIAQSPLAKQI